MRRFLRNSSVLADFLLLPFRNAAWIFWCLLVMPVGEFPVHFIQWRFSCSDFIRDEHSEFNESRIYGTCRYRNLLFLSWFEPEPWSSLCQTYNMLSQHFDTTRLGPYPSLSSGLNKLTIFHVNLLNLKSYRLVTGENQWQDGPFQLFLDWF